MTPAADLDADCRDTCERLVTTSAGDWSDANQHDDVRLVARLQRGDDQAYEIVVRRYRAHLLRTARRLIRDEDLAGEAVQDAFLSAFRSIHRFREDARLGTWLHRIVINAALMKLRTAARRPEVSLESLLPAFTRDGRHTRTIRPWDTPLDAELARGELRAIVRAMIDRLPLNARTVIILRDIEELSVADTVRVLGISGNAVKIRLHRAHQALQTLLDPTLCRRLGRDAHAFQLSSQ